MRHFNHPNILKVVNTYNDRAIVVTEDLKGDLLSNIIKKGPINERNVAKLIKEILRSVNHFHTKTKHETMLRNLSPESIKADEDFN